MIYKYRKPLLGKSEGGFSIDNAEGGHVCPPPLYLQAHTQHQLKTIHKSSIIFAYMDHPRFFTYGFIGA